MTAPVVTSSPVAQRALARVVLPMLAPAALLLARRRRARADAAARGVRDHLATVVPHGVVAARGFDPRATGGRVGKLQRELTRKRGGMKVRELMSTYGDLVTQALPCVLVSPDSLARFFSATAGQFDVVVFDEALRRKMRRADPGDWEDLVRGALDGQGQSYATAIRNALDAGLITGQTARDELRREEG